MLGAHPLDPFFIEAASVLLFTIGFFGFIGFCWNRISEWRWIKALLSSKPADFHNLYDEIVALRDDLVAVIDGSVLPRSSLNYGARLWELSVSLNGLGVGCPDRPPSFARTRESLDYFILWYSFLVSLAAPSRIYDLRGARATLRTVRRQVEQTDFEQFMKDRQ